MQKIKQGMTRWFGGISDGVPAVYPVFVTAVSNGWVCYREGGQVYGERADSFRFWFRTTYRKACRARDETVAHER